MKRAFLIAMLIMAFAIPSWGITYKQLQFVDEYDIPRTDVTRVKIYTVGTHSSATIYKDRAASLSITNPMDDDSTNTTLTTYNGLISFWSNAASYKLEADVGGTTIVIDELNASDRRIIVPHTARPGANRNRGVFIDFTKCGHPVATISTGGAVTGADTTVDYYMFPVYNAFFEMRHEQANSEVISDVDTYGWDINGDETQSDGAEVTNGIQSTSPCAFTVGTDGPFHFKCRFRITDADGTGECAVGFRKAEAYQDAVAVDDYDEMAAFNVQAGVINIETILNNATTDTTDTTEDDWANNETHDLGIFVDRDGAVTFTYDGSAPAATATFSFDADEVVVPFFAFLHNSGIADNIQLVEWDCGLD